MKRILMLEDGILTYLAFAVAVAGNSKTVTLSYGVCSGKLVRNNGPRLGPPEIATL
jgi:hypothetical protein